MNDLEVITQAIKISSIRTLLRDISDDERYLIEIVGDNNKYQLNFEARPWHTGDYTYPAYDLIVSCNNGPARRFIDEICLRDFQEIWDNFKSTYKEAE